MRCPNCGAPVPEGNGRCFDCGTLVGEEQREPWEMKPASRARKNTGEKTYRQGKLRQQLHEQLHTSHSTSKEAERDYDPDAPVHSHPAGGEKARRKEKDAEKAAGISTAGRRKSTAKLVVLLQIVIGVCMILIVNLVDRRMDSDFQFTGPVGTATADEWVREENADGSYIERYYDSDGQLQSEWIYDASDNPQQWTYYYSDGSWDVESFDEDGNMAECVYYDSDGNVTECWRYTYDLDGHPVEGACYDANGNLDWSWVTEYDSDGNYRSEFNYDGDGSLISERYFAADGNVIGERYYEGGQVTDVWGTDSDGNPLE